MSDRTFAEFSETLTLEIPNISDQLIEFSEARAKSRGLVIELAAIHAGITENFNHYSAKELNQSLKSWVSPYPKPIILNHDLQVDPVGRVMAAKMDQEKDGTPFVRLQVAVTDPKAMEKIADTRYLTGSVGGKSESALCSICSADWAEATSYGPRPCKHVRGKAYKGQVAYLERINLEFKEYSFVNAPADSRSQIIQPHEDGEIVHTETSEGWITPAHFFAINMDKEEVLEYTESASRNVLENMRKKESSPLYLSLKGAFLSSLAEAEMHDDKETSAVSETVELQEDEDLLAVTEQLSDDLAGAEDAEEEATEEAASDEEADVEEGAEDADESTDDGGSDETLDQSEEASEDGSSDEVTETQESEDEEVEEAGRPQGQEKAHDADVDSQFNTPTKDFPKPKAEGDKTRENDESTDDVEEADVDATEEELEDSTTEDAEQPTEEATKTREQELLEENARLKKALHRMLAERVVDTKIAIGVETEENRSAVLEDHLKRSASSLADSIRDLAALPAQKRSTDYQDMPDMSQEDATIVDDGSQIDGETEEAEETSPLVFAEQLLVDTLMGRRKL